MFPKLNDKNNNTDEWAGVNDEHGDEGKYRQLIWVVEDDRWENHQNSCANHNPHCFGNLLLTYTKDILLRVFNKLRHFFLCHRTCTFEIRHRFNVDLWLDRAHLVHSIFVESWKWLKNWDDLILRVHITKCETLLLRNLLISGVKMTFWVFIKRTFVIRFVQIQQTAVFVVWKVKHLRYAIILGFEPRLEIIWFHARLIDFKLNWGNRHISRIWV